jgi:TonB family protein
VTRAPFAALLVSVLSLAASADVAMPTDPDALYALVLKSQGLNFTGVKPWHNHILGFQGHTVPGEILTNIRGKTRFKLTVDSLDSLQGANDALLSPPSDAVLIPPGTVQISSGGMLGLRTVSAVIPALAEKDHFEGVVLIQATIDRNGHVTNPKILRGPRIYQQSALNAVSQWVFRPFLLGGEPAEVDTQLGVAFNLGH